MPLKCQLWAGGHYRLIIKPHVYTSIALQGHHSPTAIPQEVVILFHIYMLSHKKTKTLCFKSLGNVLLNFESFSVKTKMHNEINSWKWRPEKTSAWRARLNHTQPRVTGAKRICSHSQILMIDILPSKILRLLWHFNIIVIKEKPHESYFDCHSNS